MHWVVSYIYQLFSQSNKKHEKSFNEIIIRAFVCVSACMYVSEYVCESLVVCLRLCLCVCVYVCVCEKDECVSYEALRFGYCLNTRF